MRSWYMPKASADRLAALVDDVHFATRLPKHLIMGALVNVIDRHRDEVEAEARSAAGRLRGSSFDGLSRRPARAPQPLPARRRRPLLDQCILKARKAPRELVLPLGEYDEHIHHRLIGSLADLSEGQFPVRSDLIAATRHRDKIVLVRLASARNSHLNGVTIGPGQPKGSR